MFKVKPAEMLIRFERDNAELMKEAIEESNTNIEPESVDSPTLEPITREQKEEINTVYNKLKENFILINTSSDSILENGKGTTNIKVELKRLYNVEDSDNASNVETINKSKKINLLVGENNYPVEIENGEANIDVVTAKSAGSIVNIGVEDRQQNEIKSNDIYLTVVSE